MTANIPGGSAADRRAMTFGVSQVAMLVYGVIFLAVGIVGFFVTGFDDFADHHPDDKILAFEVNPLHNVVHIVLGVLAIVAALRLAWTIAYGIVLFVGYGATFVYGLFAVDEDWDFLSLNWADNWLHLGAAIVGLIIAAIGKLEWDRRRAGVAARQATAAAQAGPGAPA